MSDSFPIAGVGASAGGIEALTEFMRAAPSDSGAAFVLIQHLSPAHSSALAEILGRVTAMPVSEVQDEALVEPNHVYVIPPAKTMALSGGHLRLTPRQSAGIPHPIDHFLVSLAQDHGHAAIGVILSGTATDGTLGIKEIKAAGGTTFAQDSTAAHEGMPRNAVASGYVDFVLPPDEIAKEIARIARHPYVADPEPPAEGDGAPARAASAGDEPAADDVAPILQALNDSHHVDFALYKPTTLKRRIARRMMLQRTDNMAEYAELLASHPSELDALFHDILIGVTGFFRDPETFDVLSNDVLPALFTGRSREDTVRVWVLGCSTGEEAYSYGIALSEAAERAGSKTGIQIFATDLNSVAIDVARAGVYGTGIESDVSAIRLRRHFSPTDEGYRISKTLRDMCVFAQHNVLTDPPFSRMDIISCRNLLIYLEPTLQKSVLPTLHYALRPNGTLVLGGSETIGAYRDLFEPRDSKHRIYTRRAGASRWSLGAPAVHPAKRKPADAAARPPEAATDEGGAQKEADRILLSRYAPPAVLVNANLEIIQFRGDTTPYLAPPQGRASFNVTKMAREGLVAALLNGIRKARATSQRAREDHVRVASATGPRETSVEVIPLKGQGDAAFLVLFEPADGESEDTNPTSMETPGAETNGHDSGADAPASAQVMQELAVTREYLQAVIEQQEAVNEELQSANEEAQSANEELQSINEELETSKEEIESSNEELATVNEELRNRNDEMGRLNNDLVNLLGSLDTPVVMLAEDLRIRRFTPAAERLFGLHPTDIGRPLRDLKDILGLPDIHRHMLEVMTAVAVREFEVLDASGHAYSLRLRPYRTLDNQINGVVMTAVDVDTLTRALTFAENIVDTVREPLAVLDEGLRVIRANRSFYDTFRVATGDTEQRALYDLAEGAWDIPALRVALTDVASRGAVFEDFEITTVFPQIGERHVLLNARRLPQTNGKTPLVLLAIEDVTVRYELEASRSQIAFLKEAERSKDEFLAMLAHELRNPLAPLRNALQILIRPDVQPAVAHRALEMMERQIGTVTRLIDDLLDSARVTQGKIDLRKEPLELVELLERIANATGVYFETRKQDFRLALPEGPIMVEGDEVRMEQIFGNLLNNASKFTQPGGLVSLSAQLIREDGQSGPPSHVHVSVRDNGIGMSAELLPRIFDLFAQADRSLDRSQGGLGIGLTLSRRLTEMHGGTLTAWSAGVGAGSEFVVTLPLLENPHSEPI